MEGDKNAMRLDRELLEFQKSGSPGGLLRPWRVQGRENEKPASNLILPKQSPLSHAMGAR